MEKKINDLKRVLQQFSLIAQQLLTENNSLKETCSNQQSDLEKLRQSYSDSERNLGVLQERYESLVSECDSLRDKVEQKEQAKKKKETLVSENADLKSQVEKLQAKVRELEAEITRRDREFYSKVSALLQSIQERCNDNGAVVTSIKSKISGSCLIQKQESSFETSEHLQDDEALETDRSNDSTEDSYDSVSGPPLNPSDNDNPDSNDTTDENSATSNGGLYPIDIF